MTQNTLFALSQLFFFSHLCNSFFSRRGGLVLMKEEEKKQASLLYTHAQI